MQKGIIVDKLKVTRAWTLDVSIATKSKLKRNKIFPLAPMGILTPGSARFFTCHFM